MGDSNPWLRISNLDYERHMGHGDVGQLQALSAVTRDQLALVQNINKPMVAILGISNGNGLEDIDGADYASMIGIDINDELLDVCRSRCSSLIPVLQLHRLDLMAQRREAVALLRGANLVTANLLVEHIHLDAFLEIVGELERAIVSVTIQVNPDGALVSRSGYEGAFSEVIENVEECDEGRLVLSMEDQRYRLAGRREYPLPNGKSLVRLDFHRP